MANGHVDTLDPASNHDANHADLKSASDMDSMADTVEYRIMMAYASRRRTRTSKDVESPARDASPGRPDPSGTSSNQTPVQTEQKKKKKKKIRRFFKCLRPQTDDGDPADDMTPCGLGDSDLGSKSDQNGPSEALFRSGPSETSSGCGDGGENDKLDTAVRRLTEITDEIPFTPPEYEEDSKECNNVEKLVGILLREKGDEFNRQVLSDASLLAELTGSYSFFDKLISAFFQKLGIATSDPTSLGPQASSKTQIALTCEVSSRLSAVDTLASSRMLRYGARYLHDHFSSWATLHGGYENALNDGEDDDEVQ